MRWGPLKQNRNIGFFSDESEGYKYTGYIAVSKPLTENLLKLLNRINKKFDTNFNGILVNEYLNGDDYIGPHSDKESDLSEKGVVSISYGANRIFRIRHRKSNKIFKDINTGHCKIIHMEGDKFQSLYKHEIPKTKKVHDVRYSFTFRCHNR